MDQAERRHLLVAVFDDPDAGLREAARLNASGETDCDVGYAQICGGVRETVGTLADIGGPDEDLVDRLVTLGIPVESALVYAWEFNHCSTILTIASRAFVTDAALKLRKAGARHVREWPPPPTT
jgi:hypothetical protein